MSGAPNLSLIHMALLAAPLASCAVYRTPHLVPITNGNAVVGVLTATMVEYGQGRGAIEILSRSGEEFEGEYAIFFDGPPESSYGLRRCGMDRG